MGNLQTTDREVSGLVLRAVLSYVERAAGIDALQEVAERSGISDLDAALRDNGLWYSVAETLRVANAAAQVCGEASIGRRTGEEQILGLCDHGFREFVVALATVPAAMEQVLQNAQRMSAGRRFTIAEAGEHHLLIESETAPGLGHHRFFCEYIQGVLATIPTILGLAARIVERRCQGHGDDRCRFHLSWGPDPRTVPNDLDLAASEALVEARLSALEDVQGMAAGLLASHNVDAVLEQICDHATATLEAPRFLLAVRVGTTGRLRVHQRGFADDAEARARAEHLTSTGAERNDGDGMLIADVAGVAARAGAQGVLAVLSISGATYAPWEVRTLEAYARHAGSALDIVTALDRAQRDRDAARALLTLASELASATTTDEVADHLTRSTPGVVGCDTAMLWSWEPERRELQLGSFVDSDASTWGGPTHFQVDAYPELVEFIEARQPYMMWADDATGVLEGFFDLLGIDLAVSVPIVAHGNLLGVLNAGFHRTPDDDDHAGVLAALGGLADHAATALENARLLEDIRHQAMHDTLTGLPNRPLIEDRVSRCLLSASRTGASNALLFVDLDRFKNVNDTLGHAAGDDLIRQVAERLCGMMRASDTVARVGGDEFVVLLADSDERTATEVGQRIVTALQSPFVVAGNEVFISCSIGIACAPRDGTTYESLVRHADAAMYVAKSQGRNMVALHTHGDAPVGSKRLELETALHKAIELDQLRVLYQPQVDVATGRLVAVEALVRWEHPTLGLLAPADFLELAEQTGLIVTIDAWVRQIALAQIAAWASEGIDLRLALNVSSRDLQDPRFPATIAAEIMASGVDPSTIELEITDRVTMDECELLATLRALKDVGVRLAIDDFGTGTSVLGRLQRCPVDTLKIDRSFLAETAPGSSDELIVRALVTLGQSLRLEVVAEGVEELDQHALLVQCGCDLAQGYLFSRPVEPAALTAYARRGAGLHCVVPTAAR